MGQGKGIKPMKASLGYGNGTPRESKSQARANSHKDKSDNHHCTPGVLHLTRPGAHAGGGNRPKYPTHPTVSVNTK